MPPLFVPLSSNLWRLRYALRVDAFLLFSWSKTNFIEFFPLEISPQSFAKRISLLSRCLFLVAICYPINMIPFSLMANGAGARIQDMYM